MKRAKGKWVVRYRGGVQTVIVCGEDTIAFLESYRKLNRPSEITKANAEFIVRACNNFKNLLKACKRFVRNSPCQNNCNENDMSCDTQFAKVVIAKAERK